jgi:hypothetical protein
MKFEITFDDLAERFKEEFNDSSQESRWVTYNDIGKAIASHDYSDKYGEHVDALWTISNIFKAISYYELFINQTLTINFDLDNNEIMIKGGLKDIHDIIHYCYVDSIDKIVNKYYKIFNMVLIDTDYIIPFTEARSIIDDFIRLVRDNYTVCFG